MDETNIKVNNNIPSVSVVIPVRNEVLKIRKCIEGIISQTVPVKEIIVIDSGSTDGTIEILEEYSIVKLIKIPSSDFNHGLTRNLGVSYCSGDYILLTVGDAYSYNKQWIQELLNGFQTDRVAGVCGQQVVPHDIDKNPIQWFKPVSVPRLKKFSFLPNEFNELSPEIKKNVCSWDDVTAMYRRSVLNEIPFRKTSYSEDALWAKDAIIKGYEIVYNPLARVYHYHFEDPEFTFKRGFTTMYFRYREFEFLHEKPKLGFIDRIRIIKHLMINTRLNATATFKWYYYNINNIKARLKAYEQFMFHLNQGEESLDEAHEKYCGKPPIPIKVK